MISREDHIRIGRLLGIPDCCIEAFNSHTQMVGVGVLRGPCRSQEEMRAIWEQVSEWLGEPWGGKFDFVRDDPRRAHVPCHECFIAVLSRRHPDGWVFDEDHDLICDVNHRARGESVIHSLAYGYSRTEGAIHS